MTREDGRFACPSCRAVFRRGFRRCPIDGNAIVSLTHDPLVGTILADRYAIEQFLGEGATGRVYEARHSRVSRRFAIKVLFGEMLIDEKTRSRFAREAEAASRLNHPNVISVTDFGETKTGLQYLAMDYVQGIELSQVLRSSGPLAAPIVADYVTQLSMGLEHAHRRGLIHRDFKSENILVEETDDGRTVLRIVDFGIAVMRGDDYSDRLTTDGTVIGTLPYMSPEQAAGQPLDHRSDLFSLGILMYRLLSGVLPFEGTPLDMARSNLTRDPPPVSARVPGLRVDPALEGIAIQLMAKHPRDRFPSAASVADAIAGSAPTSASAQTANATSQDDAPTDKRPLPIAAPPASSRAPEPPRASEMPIHPTTQAKSSRPTVRDRRPTVRRDPTIGTHASTRLRRVVSGPVIGIDLGTTNSCVSVVEGGIPRVIKNQEGSRTTPSIVAWTDGSVLVGATAERQRVTNAAGSIYSVKRLMGQRYDSDVTRALRETLAYSVVSAPNQDAWVSVEGRAVSPPEVSAHIISKLRQAAETHLGQQVRDAVVTVPAYFDDAQRAATKHAAAIAGIEVHAILNEPTAAAIAYGVRSREQQKIAVFDLGGGTFDVSLLAMEEGTFEVLATAGDARVGGDDFDRMLVATLIEEVRRSDGVDLSDDPVALQRLHGACEQAKISLSSYPTADINLPFIAMGKGGPIHLQRVVSRSEFTELASPLLSALCRPCERAMGAANLTPRDIDRVLLVGGMTRMLAVQNEAYKIFRQEPTRGVNPDEIVAVGAGVYAHMIMGEQELMLVDVTSHSLGVKIANDRMCVLIPANTALPVREKKVFQTTSDGQPFVALEVYQGESEIASENRFLGRFVLENLPRRSSGTIRIDVTFALNSNGMLEVTAADFSSGRAQTVATATASGLGSAELEAITRRYRDIAPTPAAPAGRWHLRPE